MPRLPKVTPVSAAPSFLPATGLKNRSASVVPGCWPRDAERAAEPQGVDRRLAWKNGSSDISQETLALGYIVALKFLPNALLSSNRRAPVTNSRSLSAISSST